MNKDLLLTIDVGTQSARAMLFDAHGSLLGKGSQALHYQRPSSDRVEADPEMFWQAIVHSCQRLWQQHGDCRERVAAVSLTTQRATVIALDENYRPVYPAILWMDKRRLPKSALPRLSLWWEAAFRLAGVTDTIRGFQAECEIAWLQAQEPEAFRRIRHYGLLSSYLSFRLTGAWQDSLAAQVGYLPFDFKQQRWANERSWQWQACPVAPEWLPTLVKPGELQGSLSNRASEELGLQVGLPLVASGADKACEVLGSGCLTPERACLSYGTTATVNLSLPRHIHPLPFLPSYPAAAQDFFNAEYQIYRGYWLVSWFKHEFGHPEQQRAIEQGGVPEQFFDALIEQVPPGAEGLILQPYWSPGVREPGPEARGAVIGWADHHTRAHLYRAILEGIAYGLRQGLDTLQKRANEKVIALRISGGGSQSDAAMQLTADIFNRPAERLREYETSGLGAAINAAVHLGWQRDYPAAIAAMCHVGQVFEPRASAVERYEQLYRRVYLPLYKQLKPLYQSLADIADR